MNSWKLNGMAGSMFRRAVCKSLGIKHSEIYKKVKKMSYNEGLIELHDGRKFVLELKELKDD